MKIYFAGISGHKKRLEYLKEFGAKRLMLTFAESKFYNKQLPRFRDGDFDIIFDSGAFSLWRRGFNIDIQQYCDYLQKHSVEKYIVLDKIGDHEQTMFNQKIMEDAAMVPIPVYHLNSPIDKLAEICDKYPYVCLGGTVGSSYKVRMSFFAEVFQKFPLHKFHGLGLTDARIMKSFPFYSVDSTTWLVGEKAGNIVDKNGKQFKAPLDMSTKDKFKNNIEFFVSMET